MSRGNADEEIAYKIEKQLYVKIFRQAVTPIAQEREMVETRWACTVDVEILGIGVVMLREPAEIVVKVLENVAYIAAVGQGTDEAQVDVGILDEE